MGDNDELTVWVYDVGFGDCIYIKVPDRWQDPATGEVKLERRHILIDCGTVVKQGTDEPDPGKSYDPIKVALRQIRKELPDVNGKGCLDLLVVTHPHKDHLSGFSPARMRKITSKHIWLSVFMDKHHPGAQTSLAVQDLAFRAAWSLWRRGLRLGPFLMEYLEARKANETNIELLTGKLAEGTEPGAPLYVCRDIAERKPELNQDHHLCFSENTTWFDGFKEAGTRLRVLAPEWDIDHFYLSEDAHNYVSLLANYTEPEDYGAFDSMAANGGARPGVELTPEAMIQPTNISRRDFRVLRKRLVYSAMRFSQDDDHLKNNVSIVLLLEWRGRKLLFAGDAEWRGGYDEESHNGSWDVLLELDEKGPKHLRDLDFLKVGHHGSTNATPWFENQLNQPILERMLPEARKGDVKLVVSTCQQNKYPTVPCTSLVSEQDGLLHKHGTVLMTNKEADLVPGEGCVKVTFGAAPGWDNGD